MAVSTASETRPAPNSSLVMRIIRMAASEKNMSYMMYRKQSTQSEGSDGKAEAKFSSLKTTTPTLRCSSQVRGPNLRVSLALRSCRYPQAR